VRAGPVDGNRPRRLGSAPSIAASHPQ